MSDIPKFKSPSFDYESLVQEYNAAETGQILTVNMDSSQSQSNLIHALKRRGLATGKDFQTMAGEDVCYLRKLSDKAAEM